MRKFTLVFIALQICSYGIYAQWSGDEQVADTKVCTANANQNTSFIIPDGSGGAIIFWKDSRGGTGQDIYYNKLNSTGVTVWSAASAGLSLTNTTIYNTIDQVISDGNGGAFITWETDDGANFAQLVQHISNAGAKTWAATGVSLSNTAFGGNICSDGNGGIIITWSDYRDDLEDQRPQTFAQRVNSSGTVQWTASGIPVENATGFSAPFGIIPDGAGGAIISITDTRNSNYDAANDLYDNLDIYAQRINASGNAVWAAAGLPVCTFAKGQGGNGDGKHPYVVPDGSGGAVIAWQDFRNDPNNGNRSPYNSDIFCQRINANGVAQWAADGISLCIATGSQEEISLMPDGTGGAVAVWYEEQNGNSAIVTQKIKGSGIVQWTVNGKLVVSQNHPVSYTASPDATNSAVLLTWADPLNSPQDITAQKISIADGSFLWGNEGILVCGRTDAQSEPAITHNGGGGAIISWTDGRNSSQDIYANRVLANGTLPLMLVTFEAQLINQGVLLKWSTSSEQNTSYFDVERSADGNNFSSIGKINAAGNSTSSINYSLPDNDPSSGNNFYRLKMVDVDGKFIYSKIVTVNIIEGKFLRIYPNPVKNTLYLHASGINENALIQIMDLSGKKVKEQKLVLTGRTPVDISNLSKSVYKIIIKTKANTEELTFVKE